jgi:hypothetical protein
MRSSSPGRSASKKGCKAVHKRRTYMSQVEGGLEDRKHGSAAEQLTGSTVHTGLDTGGDDEEAANCMCCWPTPS